MSDESVKVDIIRTYGTLTLEQYTHADKSTAYWIKRGDTLLVGLSDIEVAVQEFKEFVDIEKRYERLLS